MPQADDQQRLEVSRQRHKLEQQGLSSTAQLPAEHPESPAAAVVAQMVRRREREAKRLARKAAAAQVGLLSSTCTSLTMQFFLSQFRHYGPPGCDEKATL